MKIERINENKIKVTLSLDDLHERNIDLSALSYNSPQAQQLFMDMMHIAESEHGFFVGDSQIFIEAVPTPPEGFEIIVTKVEDDKEFESIHKYIKNKLKKSDISSKRRSKNIITNVFVCSFSCFEDLCEAVKHIGSLYVGYSSLYKLKSNYYLVLYKNYKDDQSFKPIEMVLHEFGEKVSSNIFLEGLLDERGDKLIEDSAVDVVKGYFN